MSLDAIAVLLAVIGWGGGISMSMYASRLEGIIKELKQERDTLMEIRKQRGIDAGTTAQLKARIAELTGGKT